MKNCINGIIAPICTPFIEEEVNIGDLTKNVEKYSQTPLNGFFVLGTNGENKSLSDPEKIIILETVMKYKNSTQILIAGVTSESTKLTKSFFEDFSSIGVDYISLLAPSYYKKQLNDEVLKKYFMDVADVSPIPIMIYHAPSYNGITLSTKLIENLSKHPNIFGMKDTSQGLIFNYLEVCKENEFAILSGTINSFFPAVIQGASGGVVSLANAFPKECNDLYLAIKNGNLELGKKINSRLLRLNMEISGSYGVAGVKYAMDLKGYYGGVPRLPLLPLSKVDEEKIRNAVLNSSI